MNVKETIFFVTDGKANKLVCLSPQDRLMLAIKTTSLSIECNILGHNPTQKYKQSLRPKTLPGTNTLAYYVSPSIMKKKVL